MVGRSALAIVDVQNDFCPGGALPVPEGDRVVPVLNRYIAQFEQASLPIFASRDWHPAKTKHFKAYGGLWPPHCVQETPGAAFHPDLKLPAPVTVVSKGMDAEQDSYSCFQAQSGDGTPFEKLLHAQGIEHLYVGGLATDYCVRSSVLDALRAGFRVTLLEDAIRGVELQPGDSERAMDEMTQAGALRARLDEVATELAVSGRR